MGGLVKTEIPLRAVRLPLGVDADDELFLEFARDSLQHLLKQGSTDWVG